MTYRIVKLKTNNERTYIRLSEVIDWIEPEIIGGKNKANLAKQMATVYYGNQEAIKDDIASDKKIFRKRSKDTVTRFLDEHNLQKGDEIKIERLRPYTYKFTPA